MADNRKKKKEKKNTVLIVLIVLAVLILAGLVAFGVMKDKKEAPAVTEEPEVVESIYGDESLCIDPEVDKALSDYRMVEIVGLDNKHRSDVMFIIAINKKNNNAKMFTVYRDTLMKMSPDGTPYKTDGLEFTYFKCNHSYKMDGNYANMKMMNSHLDLNIREILGLDWDGVEFLVNEIGGIELDGATLNGEQAVAHLRERKKAGWDAGTRSRRNEDILIQVFEKVKQMDTESALELYNTLSHQFITNMSSTTITDTIATLSQIDVETYDGFPYDYEILWDQYDRYYYWVAQDSLKDNVIKLHQDVFGQADYVPSATSQQLSDELEKYKETLH